MKFNYLARNQKGETQTGTIKALNESAALDVLHENNLIVLKLKAVEKSFFLLRKIKFFERVKKKDVFIFFRQLAILAGANVPLVQSLRTLGQQSESSYLGDVLFNIANEVDGGKTFSKAMSKYPKVFSSFAINLVQTGEVSGRLQESLTYLADYLEKEYYIATRIRNAMVYPAFIFGVFIIIGILVLVMVIPQLTAVLVESGQELPLPTKMIIGASDFARSFGWIVLLVFFVGAFFGWRYLKKDKGRMFWDRFLLKVPILKMVLRKTYLARISDSLNALTKGGISIVQSLTIAGDVVGNVVYKRILLKAKDGVKSGKKISSELKKYDKEFPPLYCQMISTGERTGKLNMILEKLSNFYNKEVASLVENMSILIEPVLIVFLGAMVAILVFAVFMPIYNLVGAF